MENIWKIDPKTMKKSSKNHTFWGLWGALETPWNQVLKNDPYFHVTLRKSAHFGPQGDPDNRTFSDFFWKITLLFTDYFRNRIFIDFWSLPDPLGRAKTMKNHCTVIKNQGFAKVGKRRLRGRFWYNFPLLLHKFSVIFGAWSLFKNRIKKVTKKHRKITSKRVTFLAYHEPIFH